MPRRKRPAVQLPKDTVQRLAQVTRDAAGNPNVKMADLSTKPRTGRPPALEFNQTTIAVIVALGQVQGTLDEIGAAFGCGAGAVANFFTREPAAKSAYDEAIMQGRASLRVIQFRLAQKNVAMAIFLGKNLLGQKDVVEYAPPAQKDATDSAIAKLTRRFEALAAKPAAGVDPVRTGEGSADRGRSRSH